jgi:poly(3-hydroxybutyrate) depolymerase
MRIGRQPATLFDLRVLAALGALGALGSFAAFAGCATVSSASAGGGVGGGSASNGTVTMTANVTPLAVDLRAVPLDPGLRWVNLTSDAPVQRRMMLVVPEGIDSGGPRPLVIFLHGASGGAKLADRLGCLVVPAFARVAPIIVAPEAEGGEWWNRPETALVLGVMDAAVRDWRANVDDKRVVVMGYSNGGIGAWFFARLYPEGLSAAIPMSANHAIVGDSPLPIRVIHGSADRLFDVDKVRERVQATAQRGTKVSIQVREGGQHEDACCYEAELDAAVAWLQGSVWKSPAPAATAAPPGPAK